MFNERYSVHIHGTVNAVYTTKANAHIQYQIVSRPPWKSVYGNTAGKTALGKRQSSQQFGHRCIIAHQFQLQLVKEQANPLGWPQIVFEAYEMSFAGKDKLIGYGILRVPLFNSREIIKVPIFYPTVAGDGVGAITGIQPELNDPKLLAQSTSRGHISTKSTGEWIEVLLDTVVV
ncbi:B9 domain-containing protein [Spironucleus salmonicida]|uniref:B9 domain-containing protein 1 n=1 Tax=Spironucleus salmonicida TaxID=348837 RepID=V6LWL9_9EUKA|nr:B9 domain-containing protein [Spironucleus salmonicida]|eukprot:EST45179.1 B9 domain-containing protein [Spironucleus salmonicida]